ncbi:DUF4234 domain-containing protein [Kitasatospora sp. MAP5-34]|uniref:DUF4234 domain-containing protein n=1 Tax=Kitasatospora sp. MAP5-34 TaxID=3035102 RepID=UPI002473C18F|nr:DUF4234 domain-containing protein [Kitasatospora sp. MAP5-34]MDH6580074.1 hypothetical protein [Kitasatospora sp. MAP5-34]
MTGRAGKYRNLVLVWLIWPLITLGIYHYVWYYKINREAKEFDARIDSSPLTSLLAILIGWVLIVPPFISVFNTGKRIAQMQRAAGMQASCNPWIGLLLVFLFGLHSMYYQYELNTIWAHYGDPAEGERIRLAV